MTSPVAGNCFDAALSLLAAQKGTGIQEMIEISEPLEAEKLKDAGYVQYENLEISWIIETENCENLNGHYLPVDEKNPSQLAVTCNIQIHNDGRKL